MQLFHVIWTTFNEYPVYDKRGSFQQLKETNNQLIAQQIGYVCSKDLPEEYILASPQPGKVRLTEQATLYLKEEIERLCKKDADRIINELDIKMIKIDESKIELLVYTNANELNQKIARLKSRTSSLLSFKFPDTYVGKSNYGKGIWYASILNKELLAISIIKNAGYGKGQ